jgi:hypothetical protein
MGNVAPLQVMKTALGAGADFVRNTTDNLRHIVESGWMPGSIKDPYGYDALSRLDDLALKMYEIGRIALNLDDWITTQLQAPLAEARAWAAAAQTRLNNFKGQAGEEWTAITAWTEQKAHDYYTAAIQWADANATTKANAALSSANQNIQAAANQAASQLNAYKVQVDNWANSEVRPRLPTRTPAQQAEYFKNRARPAYEESMEFFLQNSLWNLRNRQPGSLEWDGIARETTDKANAALEAANQNISNVDAKLAAMISDRDGRVADLENKLPLTTAALNQRIDEANQTATDKANAALAGANQNLATARDKLESEIADLQEAKNDLQARVRKMEAEIEKVAPVLARLPKIPVS